MQEVQVSASLRAMPAFRERALLFGVGVLSDEELVALLLGSGTRGRSAVSHSQALLEAGGGLRGLLRLDARGLLSVGGFGPAAATRLAAALELGQRLMAAPPSPERFAVDCFEAVVAWARPRLLGLEHEEVWLLVLDGRNHLKSARRIAQGGLHGCALTAKDVLRPALRDGGSAIVLVHNHPSGDPQPSRQDVVMTEAVVRACEAVGLELMDHVIIADGGARSLFEEGGPKR
jgi:DNA repair protein RadC